MQLCVPGTHRLQLDVLPLAEHLVGAVVLRGAEALQQRQQRICYLVVKHLRQGISATPAGSTRVSGERGIVGWTRCRTYVDALDAQHPIEALAATAVSSAPCRLALADHDVVLILHLALPVAVLVGLDELPHSRDALATRSSCGVVTPRGLRDGETCESCRSSLAIVLRMRATTARQEVPMDSLWLPTCSYIYENILH